MTDVKEVKYTPEVVSFIPLLYAAWADGLLSPSEVEIIKTQLDALKHLPIADKRLLMSWADPSRWPDERTFREWMSLMKDASGHLETEQLDSVVELGLEMATRARVGRRDHESVQATRQALERLSRALDVPGMTKFRALGVDGLQVRKKKRHFDPTLMQEYLEGEQREIKGRLKLLLSDPEFSREPIRDKETYRLRILHWLQHLADQGYGALGFPKAYGGAGDIGKYAAVFETLSMFDLSLAVKFGVQFGLFGGSVQELGTETHHRAFLPLIGKGQLLGCFAMTESNHGSNVRDLETTATFLPEEDMIMVHTPHEKAGKEYIGNALHAEMATVFAQLIVDGKQHGVHAVLVPIRNSIGELLPGVRVADNGYKMGLNGVDNGKIWFDHVKVPRKNLLNRFGNITEEGAYESPIAQSGKRFFTMLGTLVAGRICVAKGALAAAQVALTIAVKYALKRRQFGPDQEADETLIMDYPTHQRRLMPRIARAYALNLALEHLLSRYANRTQEDIREIETMAAGLKAYTTWFANDTIQEGREACGGKGYLWENRFADLRADADIFATFEGDNTVLMQLVAKGLLSNFKEEFNAGGFMASIRYLATQMTDTLISINPVYKRKTDTQHLLDPAFHSHAFEFRERKILYSLGARMRGMFRKRITPYDAFMRTQNHMVALAQAYIERLILVRFQEALLSLDDHPLNEPLHKVYQLFALHTIEFNKGWYLEQNYMEGVKTKAIRRQVERLCEDLRLMADDLVDAFGIPNGMLSAPIALNEDA